MVVKPCLGHNRELVQDLTTLYIQSLRLHSPVVHYCLQIHVSVSLSPLIVLDAIVLHTIEFNGHTVHNGMKPF